MKEQTIEEIRQAVGHARSKHPALSSSPYHTVSIASEELGEFAQAVNDGESGKAKKEALDTIAVLVRYLEND